MKLVKESEVDSQAHHQVSDQSYKPLIIIVSLILLVTVTLSWIDFLQGDFYWQVAMSYFMAGFFLVFSGFKLLDLSGFAEGYSTYDLIAQKWYGYGYVYPFIELCLGLGYLLQLNNPLLHWITLLVMTVSGIGVAIKVARKEPFQCACLGTFLKVPLTKVTLIEDFGMAVMALLMLLFW